MKGFILAAALAAVAMPALAQAPAPLATAKLAGGAAVVITGQQVADVRASLHSIYAADATKRPSTTRPVLAADTFRITMERRQGQQTAAVHDNDAELLFVLEGTGSVTTGGTLVNPRPPANGSTFGTGITGGTSRRIGPGDIFVVPQGTAHTFVPDPGQALVFDTSYLPRTGRFAPVAGGAVKLFHAAADLPAMEEKAKPGVGVAPRLFGAGTFLSLPPYSVNLEYRGNQGNAAIHPDEAELMVVIDGSGSIETGGTLVTAAGGATIQGGTVTPLDKGDIIFVPSGVAHLPRSASHIVLATVHIPAN